MPQICSKCLYINDGKNTSVKASLIGGVFLIGGSLILYNVEIWNMPYLAQIVAIGSLLFGILSLRNYFHKGLKSCPKCKHKTMLNSYEPEAQKLIKEHGFMLTDDKTKFCTNCHYKGEPKKIQSLKYSLLVLFAGLITIPVGFMVNPIGLIGSFLMIGIGIYGAYTNFRKPNTCPSCNKTTMIPIESDEAKSLIKQDHSESSNLSTEQTKAPST